MLTRSEGFAGSSGHRTNRHVFSLMGTLCILSLTGDVMLSRRTFGKMAMAALPATLAAQTPGRGGRPIPKPNSRFAGVQIGVITYSFMGVQATDLIPTIAKLGINEVELMSNHAEAIVVLLLRRLRQRLLPPRRRADAAVVVDVDAAALLLRLPRCPGTPARCAPAVMYNPQPLVVDLRH